MFDLETLISAVIWILAILLSLAVHEYAHAKYADWAGDPTPRSQGRVTLNPIAHLDPLGTILIIFMAFSGYGIGWGKPVPVNPGYFRSPRRDWVLCAFVGTAVEHHPGRDFRHPVARDAGFRAIATRQCVLRLYVDDGVGEHRAGDFQHDSAASAGRLKGAVGGFSRHLRPPLLGLSDGVRTDNSVRLDSDSAADWLAEPVAVYSVARA
jgi:hypothetical protein